jgi:hypothetical protein
VTLCGDHRIDGVLIVKQHCRQIVNDPLPFPLQLLITLKHRKVEWRNDVIIGNVADLGR